MLTRLIFFVTLVFLFLISCNQQQEEKKADKISIAFMADVHFHDVFADFEDGSFEGLPLTVNGDTLGATIRTMEAQLTSTRLFNENYFALRAALDDAVKRGIRYVSFPGDFSDDGQPVHVRGFKDILDEYTGKHGIEFFITTGNHDPGRPFSMPAGKSNYLGDDGKRQPVYSLEHPACDEDNSRRGFSNLSHEVICSDEVSQYGYEKLLYELSNYGMVPSDQTIYFETPFSTYGADNYRYEDALKESSYENRLYEICREGSGGEHRQAHYTNCFDVVDLSYLIEPAEGIWLLAIDANVYIPSENANPDQPDNARNFSGSGNAGYNAVITHKKHLIHWITTVSERAEKLGKILVAFSHYPAVDFYNGAADEIQQLWGERGFQTGRLPAEDVSKMLARTGLKIHVGGHMHMNDTGLVVDEESGNTLINIQAPSVAGYVPAYKILHVVEGSPNVEVETVILGDVPGFDTFFPLYRTEWEFLNETGYENIWDSEILTSQSYYEFADWHMNELSRLRFLPREWPSDLRDVFYNNNGNELLELILSGFDLVSRENAERMIREQGFDYTDFENWTGNDLSMDFYRIRNAGTLAFRDIPEERLHHYAILNELMNSDEYHFEKKTEFIASLSIVFSVMKKFATGNPDDHFIIDTRKGSIESIREISNPFLNQ